MLPLLDPLRQGFDLLALLALPAEELDRIGSVPGVMGPIHVTPGHRCVVFTAHRWVRREDGRRCALSFLGRRKAGACRVVLGQMPQDAGSIK